MSGAPDWADQPPRAGKAELEAVHDADGFEAGVADLEATFADKRTYVHRLAKRQIYAARDGSVDAGMDRAIHHVIARYREPETKRRLTAFLEN
jgi:enoyl-CoA hydratase/carnithine racemase